MAYVRFSESSDVYVYEHVAGPVHCCACSLAELDGGPECFDTTDPAEMVRHLRAHVAAGDDVPDVDELAERIRARAELHP